MYSRHLLDVEYCCNYHLSAFLVTEHTSQVQWYSSAGNLTLLPYSQCTQDNSKVFLNSAWNLQYQGNHSLKQSYIYSSGIALSSHHTVACSSHIDI